MGRTVLRGGSELLPPRHRRHWQRYVAIAGAEDAALTDSREALRRMILDIKAGKADHLL